MTYLSRSSQTLSLLTLLANHISNLSHVPLIREEVLCKDASINKVEICGNEVSELLRSQVLQAHCSQPLHCLVDGSSLDLPDDCSLSTLTLKLLQSPLEVVVVVDISP